MYNYQRMVLQSWVALVKHYFLLRSIIIILLISPSLGLLGYKNHKYLYVLQYVRGATSEN